MLFVFFWVIPCQCILVLVFLNTKKNEKAAFRAYPLVVIAFVTVISRKSPQSGSVSEPSNNERRRRCERGTYLQ